MAHGSNGSIGSAMRSAERSRNPSASWSTISTTMTASRTTTRPSCVTEPSCVRPMSTHCSNLEPMRGRSHQGDSKGGERRHDIEISGVRRRSAPPTPSDRHSHPSLKERYHDDEQTRVFHRPRGRGCSFADLHTWYGRKFSPSKGEQRCAGTRIVRRRLVLVRSDCAIAGGRA